MAGNAGCECYTRHLSSWVWGGEHGTEPSDYNPIARSGCRCDCWRDALASREPGGWDELAHAINKKKGVTHAGMV